MSFVRRSVPMFVVSLVATSVLTAAGATAATPAPVATTTVAAAQAPAAQAPAAKKSADKRRNHVVKPGVTFNIGNGGVEKRRAIMRKVNRTIANTRKGATIRIFSWKIWTYAGVTALLNAQKRGVVVKAIMDKKNTIVESNPHFPRLRKGLKAGNRKKNGELRKKAKRSGAKLCQGSCRGPGGSAHSKFFVFSSSGKSKHIYMHSSSNWGDAAANRQWNDMYTFVGDKGIYDAAAKVFDQAWKDKPVKKKERWFEHTTDDGSIVVAWSPTTKKSKKKDRLTNVLDEVKCRGARGNFGNANGRTIIRSAPDVIRGNRGMSVAKQLRKLWIAGCDVKIGYTVMGKDVNRMLKQPSRRGPVPIRHLVQDFDGDGIFDRYFHMKTLTINGRIGSNRQATWMVNGSANLSQLALVSDETFSYFINRPGITKRYQNHIDFWYRNYPSTTHPNKVVARLVEMGVIDPYAKMEMD